MIAWQMGFRQGEQPGLRRQDVSFQTASCSCATARSARHVPMSKAVREILARRLAFHGSDGCSLTRQAAAVKHQRRKNFYSRRYRPACEAAGLQDVTWHDLRHTSVATLVQAMFLFEVGALAGHSTRRYAHLVPENLRAAASIFDVGHRPRFEPEA